MTSSDNLWEDTDDKGVEEGGGNRSEQQHVSHQVPSGGRPRHRTGHTYAPASSPLSPSSYSSLTSPPSCPIIFINLLPLKPSWNYNNQQNVFHAWLQYNYFERFQITLKHFRNFWNVSETNSELLFANVTNASSDWQQWSLMGGLHMNHLLSSVSEQPTSWLQGAPPPTQ